MRGGDKLARKKEKIIVKLDLPKDDSTLTKLYAILFVSILLGLGTATVWATNSAGFGKYEPAKLYSACKTMMNDAMCKACLGTK